MSSAKLTGISHTHLDMIFGGDPQPALLVVELGDGRWYLEAERGHDFDRFLEIYQPKETPSLLPTFHLSEAAALARAREIIGQLFPGRSLDQIDQMIAEAAASQ